jgi:hypothetical protein
MGAREIELVERKEVKEEQEREEERSATPSPQPACLVCHFEEMPFLLAALTTGRE